MTWGQALAVIFSAVFFVAVLLVLPHRNEAKWPDGRTSRDDIEKWGHKR